MAPNAETDDIITMTSDFSKVHSLKAAIFYTMAFKLSLEINKNKITPKCLIAFLKVLYNVTQIKKKKLHLSNTRESTLKDPKMQFAKRHPMLFSSQIPPLLQRINTSVLLSKKPLTLLIICLKILGTLKNWNSMTRSNTRLILHRKILCFNNLQKTSTHYKQNFYLLLFHSSTAFRLQSFIFLR